MKITRRQLRQIIKEETGRIDEDTFPGLPIPGLPSSGQVDKVTEVAEILSRLSKVAVENPDLATSFASEVVGCSANPFSNQSPEDCMKTWLSNNWSSMLTLLVEYPNLMSDMVRLHKIASEMGVDLPSPR